MEISVLGVTYTLEYTEKSRDPNLESCDGYCDSSIKKIVVRDYTDEERKEPRALKDLDAYKHKVMRHEIVHAFLYESGLSINTLQFEGGWATNEELVDWVAVMGPKLYAAWAAANCL